MVKSYLSKKKKKKNIKCTHSMHFTWKLVTFMSRFETREFKKVKLYKNMVKLKSLKGKCNFIDHILRVCLIDGI